MTHQPSSKLPHRTHILVTILRLTQGRLPCTAPDLFVNCF